MTFALPHLLWLLGLPAALLVWELVRRRRFAGSEHPKILRGEAGLSSVSLADPLSAPTPLSRRRILLCAGLAFGVLALARPQWGKLDEPVFDQAREIVIAVDLSRSMTSPDVKPSRLERSKLLIQSLLDSLRGERVGLVVFSGTAFLQSPISADYEILREFLPALGPDFLPEGGTNYRQLIDTALDAFGGGSAADRYLIILSDGEATDDDWRDRIPELEKRGIRVIGLGVGTSAGSMIPDGSGGFMKDETGAVVLSKLESATLRDLAAATHGVYRDASQWVDLPALVSSTVDAGRKGRFTEQNSVRHVERYQWALAQALICLAASFWLEFPVKPRSREVRLGPPRKAPRPAAAAASALALLLLAYAPARAGQAEEPSDPVAPLSKIVSRICAQPERSPMDWAEMAGSTVTWGEHVQGENKPVPEGPVRDALAAVDAGQAENPKAADWARLRSELERLLVKPEEQKPKDQQKQDQKQDQQDKKDQNQDQRQNSNSSQNPSGAPQPTPQPQGKDAKENAGQDRPQQPQDSSQEKPRSSAFGDMRRPAGAPTPQPSPQGSMQRVGSERKDQPDDPAKRDPQLAVPLEKLEQLKNGDSPAELFGLLRRGEPSPPPANNGKNW